MDSTKKRERSKIFKCFRPPVDDGDGLINQDGGINEFDNPVVRYVAVGEKGKIMLSDEKFVEPRPDGVVTAVDCIGKSSSRRRISRVFKAVFFDTALTKKIRHSKSGKKFFRSDSCFSFKSEKMRNSFNDKILYGESSDAEDSSSNPFSSSRTISSLLSTSCSSSMNLNSRSLSERKESSPVNSMERKLIPPPTSSEIQKPKRRRRKKSSSLYSSNIALCLLFISLLVLIFWGRICSILFTLIWLFFGPCRGVNAINSAANPVDSPDTDSDEYKKRVIMEGLLERNRNKPT